MVRRVETRGGAFDVIAEGSGPAVLMLHGWPESARAWRHQFAALADAGYRAIAYDQRGYGAAPRPAAVEDYGIFHLAGDAIAVLDALGVERAAVVGHDWGAPVAYHCALFRPDRFAAVAGLSVPYAPRGDISLPRLLQAVGLGDSYILYFQHEGPPEAELEADVERTLRRAYHAGSGDMPEGEYWRPVLSPGGGLLDTAPEPPEGAWPPAWLPRDEFAHLVRQFTASGFRGGLNWYRNLERNWTLTAAWRGAPIRQPSLFIAGERDGVIRMPGNEPTPERLRAAMPDLRGVHLIPGAGHWVQQEAPEAVNAALLAFLAEVRPVL